MSTNNLLSLLTTRSKNRTNSLANRQGLSPSFSFLPRSSSTSISKHQNNSTSSNNSNNQQSACLYRVAHLLNVKIKQSYFFGFCRIQHLYKCEKQGQNRGVEKEQVKQQQKLRASVGIQQTWQQCRGSRQLNETMSESKLVKGLEKLVDFESTLSKIQVRTQQLSLKQSFGMLRQLSFYISLAQTAASFVSSKVKEHKKSFINIIKEKHNNMIRSQIIVESIAPIYKKHLVVPYQSLKQRALYPQRQPGYPKEIIKQRESTVTNSLIDSNLTQKHSEQSTTQENEVQQYLVKKVFLKEKKVSTAKPILIPNKLLKTTSIHIQQDPPLEGVPTLSQNEPEHMRRFINLKSEPIVAPLPDLIDNCTIFRQFPQELHNDITFDSCPSTGKLSAVNPTYDDCELSKQGALRKTPSYSKHRSSGNIILKGIDSEKCSPKMGNVEELLRNMKGSFNFRSVEGEKKMVHVNIPKNLYESTMPISTFHKTPTKEPRRQDQQTYKSDNKENMGERLITERAKKSNNEKGGLEEGKNKSTVLTRQRRNKLEKNQQFTARKMKIEIQNIINRRNKQLTSRNEGRQLK